MPRPSVLVCLSIACGSAAPKPPAPPPVAPRPPIAADNPLRLDEVHPARDGHAAAAPLLDLMSAELARSMAALRKHADPPYFAAYEVTDEQTIPSARAHAASLPLDDEVYAITLRSLRDILAVGNTPVPYPYLGSGFATAADSTAGYLASIAAPSLLFRDADVKKPTGAQKAPPIAPRP